ncbi:hypothetical protein H7673_10740 [Streptococcus dysgalactiae subsp. equisimilis]|nr:hypothetical protein [Streptococcus dysgalactiae subsp. equisimilis]
MEGHVGCTKVLAVIRRRFGIIQGRSAVRRVLGCCLPCRKESVQPCCQQMAPLPEECTNNPGYAFAYVGVDYFGPFLVKRGRAEEKRYGCLFTCLSICAVHIEVTHSLSTDAFLQALIRFMARRGQPQVIFSDNGTNFKGAYSELRWCLKNLSQFRIHKYLSGREVNWRFGPPNANHLGGIWKRMIKSVRKVFRAIAHGQCLTDETLSTFLAEVERILNNRPLVPMTEDVKDLDVLTPSKLLLLRDNVNFSDNLVFSRSCVRLWRRVQLLVGTFWKRWKLEYLSALQERHKWFGKNMNLKPEDLVLVVIDKVHKNQWPLTIVEQICAGSDGLVREVVVRTSRGTIRRDVRHLCLLEGSLSNRYCNTYKCLSVTCVYIIYVYVVYWCSWSYVRPE